MKLSIITINKNNADGLEKTIKSVIGQYFIDFEFIIIDGASTDNSVTIIQKYVETIYYWISEPDTGLYQAMNKGIEKATGDYCFFLNSGDIFTNNNVLDEAFKNEINSDIFCGYACGYINGRKTDFFPPDSFALRYFYGHNIPHQSEFIKRELLINLGLYCEDLKILSDYEFNIKALLSGASFQNINQQIAIIDMNGISSREENNSLLETEGNIIFKRNIPNRIMEDYYYFLDKKGIGHPAIQFLINSKLFNLLKLLYKLFGR